MVRGNDRWNLSLFLEPLFTDNFTPMNHLVFIQKENKIRVQRVFKTKTVYSQSSMLCAENKSYLFFYRHS